MFSIRRFAGIVVMRRALLKCKQRALPDEAGLHPTLSASLIRDRSRERGGGREKGSEPSGHPALGSLHRAVGGTAGSAARAAAAAAAAPRTARQRAGSGPASRHRWRRVRVGRDRPSEADRWENPAGLVGVRVGRGAEAPEARGARNRRGAPRREARLKLPRRQV